MNDQQKPASDKSLSVPFVGYIALLFAIVFFSGIFASTKGWVSMFDFGSVLGDFGKIKNPNANFTGMGGIGVKQGFLLAVSLFPSVMLALGIVEVVDHLGGLRAAQKLMTPILRPLLGIPGIAGLALITSLQSTDAGAGMTRALTDEGHITDRERTVFTSFQFSSGGMITNYLVSGALIFSSIVVPIIVPLAVIFVMKFVGANLVRFYVNKVEKGEAADGQ